MLSSEKYDFLIVNDMLLDEQVLRRTGEVGVELDGVPTREEKRGEKERRGERDI